MDPRLGFIVYAVAVAASLAYGMKLIILIGMWLRRTME